MNIFVSIFSDANLVFLKYSILAGILSSFAFGITGSYVVVKRISYIAGAISHSVLGGVGFALFLQHKFGIKWLTPYTGAVIVAVAAALFIWIAEKYSKERLDSLLGALWAAGMASGIIFISITPGYIDPMSYLFGNILMVTKTDLYLISSFSVIICITALLFQKKLIAVSFDEEFLAIRGVNTDFYKLILLIMTAFTIVLMIRIVGIIMIIAMLTIPPAAASRLTGSFTLMSILSIVLSILFVISGIGISFNYDLPGGPVIILVAGSFYLAMLAAGPESLLTDLIKKKFNKHY
ncbi:MAG: metal ABC transporter permease [Thermodesulfobacteriota bacterium]